MTAETSVDLNADESELYDRQIRLWGVDAQRRIKETRVLIIGLDGIGIEVAKNLTLSGVKKIDIFDESLVEAEKHLRVNFCLKSYTESVGKNVVEESLSAIRALNPSVAVSAVNKQHVESGLTETSYDVVACFHPSETLLTSAALARQANLPVIAAGAGGNEQMLCGFVFVDNRSDDPLMSILHHNVAKVKDRKMLDNVRALVEGRTAQAWASPIAAVIGGVVAQQVIFIATKSPHIINNLLIYDFGESSYSNVIKVGHNLAAAPFQSVDLCDEGDEDVTAPPPTKMKKGAASQSEGDAPPAAIIIVDDEK